MNQAIIVTNGIFPESFLQEIEKEKFVIGVDRAGFILAKKGILPDLVLGDMDSVTKNELEDVKQKGIKVKEFEKDKDNTDTELAVMEAVSRGYKKAVIYGVCGTRFDHLLSSVFLLEKYQSEIKLLIKDRHNEIQLVGGQEEITVNKNYRYISFISLSDFSTLTLVGLKYPLKKRVIKRGDTLCVSNEIIAKRGNVEVIKGKVLMIRSRD